MTKHKQTAARRGRGSRDLRPTTASEYRLRGHRPRRAGRRNRDFDVLFERLGQYYDDVLFSSECDEPALAAIMALPAWAGW